MPENDAFSRDLGYLDKFFDKLDAHAGNLPSDAGQQLRSLLTEERQRWAEIRRLIGADGAPSAAAEEAPKQPAAAAGESSEQQAEAQAPMHFPVHPYTRALQQGLAQLPREPAPTPMGANPTPMGTEPGGARGASRNPPSSFSVGSLKRRS